MDESMNPYTVERGQAAAPLRFHKMQREMQSLVLKHTHARFVVAHRKEVYELNFAPILSENAQILLHQEIVNDAAQFEEWLQRMPNVPVVLRYEFNLQRRLADGVPKMTARISQSLDPAFRESIRWHRCANRYPRLLAFIELAAPQVVEIEPFSQLKFDELNEGQAGVFCFLREDGSQSLAPQWSRFLINSRVLNEVRNKMQKVFCQPFSHV